MSTSNGMHFIVPISLEKGEEKPEEKGSLLTCKIRSEPTDPTSTTHELKLKIFKSGTTEEWLQALNTFMLALRGQGLDSGPAKFRFARVFLKGDALFKFNLIASSYQIKEGSESETEEALLICLRKLTEQIMPRQALRAQKRYMSRLARKPASMLFRDYVNRMNELNDYLSSFPPRFDETQKYTKEELMDIIEFGMPQQWQIKMIDNNINVTKEETSIDLLVDFGERMELIESQNRTQKMSTMSDTIPKKANVPYKAKSGLIKHGYKSHFNGKSKGKWCPYHKTDSHDANGCVVLTKLATSLAEQKANKEKQKSTQSGNGNSGNFDKKKFAQFQAFVHFQKMQEEQEKAEIHENDVMIHDMLDTEDDEIKDSEEFQEVLDGYEALDMADEDE